MLETVRKSVHTLVRLHKVSGVIFGFVIPTIAGVFVVYYPELTKINPILFWLPIVFCGLASTVYAWYTLDMPVAAEYYVVIQEERQKTEYLQDNIRYMSLLQEQVLSWNVLVRGYVQQHLPDPDDLKLAIANICDSVVDFRDEYFDFSKKELWNFSVYLWDEKGKLLRPVWRQKHAKHPSRGMGREWREGEGHVGLAFRNREPLITPDAQAPDVQAFMTVPGNAMPYDATAYRSYVSQPIDAPGSARPFGVLVATSDVPGRFDKANALVLLHASAVLASTIQVAYDSTR